MASSPKTNRKNSKRSTGPKSPAGKKRSSMNALRHGLTSKAAVMPAEDRRAYDKHQTAYTNEYRPEGQSETDLVRALADASWRLNRIAVLESRVLADPNQPFEIQAKVLSNLSLHTQRLSRQFEKTLTLLRGLQKTRMFHHNREMSDYLDVIEMHRDKGQTYDDSTDGFNFSETQKNEAILRRNRESIVAEAADHIWDKHYPPPVIPVWIDRPSRTGGLGPQTGFAG